MEFETWHVVTGIAIVLNIVVSIFIMLRDDLDVYQKSAQTLMVWLIPFFAAIGLWVLNRSHDVSDTTHKSFGGGSQDSSGAGASGGGD